MQSSLFVSVEDPGHQGAVLSYVQVSVLMWRLTFKAAP